jgi:hypothetical protein
MRHSCDDEYPYRALQVPEPVICEQRSSAYFILRAPWRKLLERLAKVNALSAGDPDIFNWHNTSIWRLVAWP